VFCPLLSSSEHSGVPGDSQPPTFPSVGLHPHTWPKWGCDTFCFGLSPLIGLSHVHKFLNVKFDDHTPCLYNVQNRNGEQTTRDKF